MCSMCFDTVRELIPVTPTSFSIGSVMDGKKVVKTVTVANKQTNSVSLSEGFSGANASDFSVTGGTCGASLAAKGTCSLQVTFAPTAVGTGSPPLRVTTHPDPHSPSHPSLQTPTNLPQ